MKSLVESKTFWLAVAQAAVAVLVVFETQYPGIGWLLIAKSVLDVIVRVYTTGPITSLTPQ